MWRNVLMASLASLILEGTLAWGQMLPPPPAPPVPVPCSFPPGLPISACPWGGLPSCGLKPPMPSAQITATTIHELLRLYNSLCRQEQLEEAALVAHCLATFDPLLGQMALTVVEHRLTHSPQSTPHHRTASIRRERHTGSATNCQTACACSGNCCSSCCPAVPEDHSSPNSGGCSCKKGMNCENSSPKYPACPGCCPCCPARPAYSGCPTCCKPNRTTASAPESGNDQAPSNAADGNAQDVPDSETIKEYLGGICPHEHILFWAPVLSPILPLPWPAATVMPWPLWTPFLFEQPADMPRAEDIEQSSTANMDQAELLPVPRRTPSSRCPKPIHRACPASTLTSREKPADESGCPAACCRPEREIPAAQEETACITVQGQRLCIRTPEALVECDRLVLDQHRGVIHLQGQVHIQPRTGGAVLRTEELCIELPCVHRPIAVQHVPESSNGIQPAGQRIPATESVPSDRNED